MTDVGDAVFSFIDGYTLPVNVQTLVLAGSARTGSGNTTDNIIIGNAADNAISGYGATTR